MEALAVASGAAGLVSLGIEVCKGLLSYYQSWRAAETEVAGMYNSIESLAKTLILLEKAINNGVFDQQMVENAEKSIMSTQDGIVSLKKKLDKIKVVGKEGDWTEKTKAPFRRAIYPLKQSVLVKLKEVAIDLRADLALALNALQIDASASTLQRLDILSVQVTDISNGVDHIKEGVTSMSIDVKDVQYTTTATSNDVETLLTFQNTREFERKQQDLLNLEGRQDGIRKWFFDTPEFRSWIAGNGRLLWSIHLPSLHVEIGNRFFRPERWYRQKQTSYANIPKCVSRGLALSGATLSIRQTMVRAGMTPNEKNMLISFFYEGAGKTVLSSLIIEHLRQLNAQGNAHGVAYIYCNYKDRENQSLQNLLSCLIHQLLLQKPHALIHSVEAMREGHKATGTSPSVAEYVKVLEIAASHFASMSIVVDALDECSEDNDVRRNLISVLLELTPVVRLLITSRDIPKIRRQLQNAIHVKVKAREDDILRYIDTRIKRSEQLLIHVNKDRSLQDLIRRNVASKAGGMFLQARLHLDSLTTKTTIRKLKTALTVLPDGINECYDEIMKRIAAQSNENYQLARRVLYWVVNALVPLTLPSIQQALAVEEADTSLDEENIPDEDLLVSVCAGLIEVRRDREIIELVHYTTQEYFELRALELFPVAQEDILRTCLTFLSFDDFSNGLCREQEDLERRRRDYPFLVYAVELLLRGGADAMAMTHWKTSPLHNAQNEEIASLLLNYGAELDRADAEGRTPLMQHAWMDREFMVAKFLDWGADIAVASKIGNTALHETTRNGSIAAARMLLEHGADINAKNEVTGRAPLHMVASEGDVALTELFLSRGSRVDSRDNVGETPLHGRTVLMLAVGTPGNLFDIFLGDGADPFLMDSQGRTCLHHAAARGSPEVVSKLLSKGLDPNLQDFDGWTPLFWAAKAGYRTNYKLLLDAGGNPRTKLQNGWTPRTVAIFHGNRRLIPLLDIPEGVQTESKVGVRRSLDEAHYAFPLKDTRTGVVEATLSTAVCDGCDLDIYGPRHKCSVCIDFDFCFKCIETAKQSHPPHAFRKVVGSIWDDYDGAEVEDFPEYGWTHFVIHVHND
ncbi:hypothetical protein G7Y79_00002g004920 [Physcia stellaris]|nr:hypothetical protein G7Y79_00002g004920 [Physcia stellaris]